MTGLHIFLFEWKHFIRSPFKVIALLLYMVAAVYGLHNGASLYQEQVLEIEKIKKSAKEERQKYISFYEEGKPGPEDRPWIDISTPFWSIWNNEIYHFKTPSPALVYSIGQAEEYGFYKQVTLRANPYDSDMTKEIANPERLQIGTLDFAFALLFLLPLLLLLLLYNLKSMEAERGFLSLVEVQVSFKNVWLLSRVSFYVCLLFLVILVLIVYGAMLTPVFSTTGEAFTQILLHSFLYLLLWSVTYYFILRSGKSILGNTLIMVGVWLIFTFIIPAVVHQWVSIEKPANLMTDFIDATRDEKQELYDLPDSVFQSKLYALFSGLEDSPVAKDKMKSSEAMNFSSFALVNELMKKSTAPIEEDNQAKNKLITNSFLFNPISFFQNRFNDICETHYSDYQNYRNNIQTLIDKQIRIMVLDTWNEVEVDKTKYLEYYKKLN